MHENTLGLISLIFNITYHFEIRLSIDDPVLLVSLLLMSCLWCSSGGSGGAAGSEGRLVGAVEGLGADRSDEGAAVGVRAAA